jgi:hypothetical protein
MEQKREHREQAEASSQVRAPYVRPELKLLGDVLELTQGAGGSVSDGAKFGSHASSIQFKKDVAYLDDSARNAIARDLLSLRLANWEYIDPNMSGGHRHLGIIIEDSPDVAAVNPSKASIDLYSYASMAIAAAQVQAKQIETLQAELAELRRELAALKR